MRPTIPLLAFVFALASVNAAAERQKIRPAGPYEAELLTAGECSSTFRSILADIEASDIIVYVQAEPLPGKSYIGALRFVSSTTTTRLLRVVLSINVDRERVIATLGHELQHALELAQAPAVR